MSWIPETYVVAAGPKAPAASPALSRFKSAFAKHAAAGRRVWIAKPTSLNRGNGIEVGGVRRVCGAGGAAAGQRRVQDAF